jgi:conjugative transfer signal peptidase TraF
MTDPIASPVGRQTRQIPTPRERNTRAFVVLALILAGTDLVSALVTWFVVPHYIVNTTSSMPYGLYEKTPITRALQHGDLISFCITDDAIRRGLQIGIDIPKGQCRSGYAPFIKRAIAVPGDRVDTRGTLLAVNGIPVARTYPLADARTKILRTIVPRIYTVGPNEAWGISDNIKGYDSRYYGAVHPDDILFPKFTWQNR